MNSNIFIWSCSRRKFAQVMAKDDEYQERLIYKHNSVWYLVIKIGDTFTNSFGDRVRSNHPVWEILLKREGGQKTTTVIAKVIKSTSFPHTKQLSFSREDQLVFIGKAVWQNIKSFFLDIVLVFEGNDGTTERYLYDSFQISRLEDLSSDFQSMLEKGQFADVVVKCSSFTMKAHKNILSASSTILEATIMNTMRKKEVPVVVIDDMEPDVCRAMLTYIYCGRIKEISISKVCGLLSAAKTFQINGLKDSCVEHLKSILSDENVLQIIEVANLYDKGLQAFAIDFLSRQFSKPTAKEDWEAFKSKYPLLALEIDSYRKENNQ